MKKRVVIIGGGFAGVWASAAAAALRSQIGSTETFDILLISKDSRLTIKPRLYEQNPSNIAVPLATITETIDIELKIGEVTNLNLIKKMITIQNLNESIEYDALVIATGSQIYRPPIPGVAEYTHDIDSVSGTATFWSALNGLASVEERPTVAVIGGGLTGIELATEIASKSKANCILIDSGKGLSDQMMPDSAQILSQALAGKKIKQKFGHRVTSVTSKGVGLADGTFVEASLVVWTAGMHASALTQYFGAEKDNLGRLITSETLSVPGLKNHYAAGDVASVKPDGEHHAPMSCQYAMPTGVIAGHNAAASLVGLAEKPFERIKYVTCVDLGDGEALITEGWKRTLSSQGEEAKSIKRMIMELIYPPNDKEKLFAHARPEAVCDPG